MSTTTSKENDMDLMVTVDTIPDGPAHDVEVDALLDELSPAGAALGFTDQSVTITLTGEGDDQAGAITNAVARVGAALEALSLRWRIAHVDVDTYDAEATPLPA